MPAQNTKPADYPQAVLQQITLLAQHIVIARKRRKETQAQWAQRLGVSQPTMARIERGDPSVAMASYVMCMWLINQANGLADLIAPQNDMASLEQEVARTRTRGRSVPHMQTEAIGGETKSTKATTAKATKTAPEPVSAKQATSHRFIDMAGKPEHATPHVAEAAAGAFTHVTQSPQTDKLLPNTERSLPNHSTNSTAVGLAALISGHKKAQP